MTTQLAFPFLNELDEQAQQVRLVEADRMRRANTISTLRATVHFYPMTDYERQVIPHRVRLARFVIGWECKKCPYTTQDHSLDNKFGLDFTNPRGLSTPLICLKDYYEKGPGIKEISPYV